MLHLEPHRAHMMRVAPPPIPVTPAHLLPIYILSIFSPLILYRQDLSIFPHVLIPDSTNNSNRNKIRKQFPLKKMRTKFCLLYVTPNQSFATADVESVVQKKWKNFRTADRYSVKKVPCTAERITRVVSCPYKSKLKSSRKFV